ncbi:MAG: hypothetical protein H6651_06500 [Ardenticatenales bacterium]|nr:hypothetical protein [Ardenticatenales bacterium]
MRWLSRIPGHLLIIILLIGCLPDGAEPTAPAAVNEGEPVAPPAATATSSPPPAVTATPLATATPLPPTGTIAPTSTALPTNTPEPPPDHLPAYSLDTPTGVAAVDEVLGVLQTGDREQLLAQIQFLEAACTNETGMGGPPKCWGGGPSSEIDPPLPEGSLVEVFPVVGAEGMWVFIQGIEPVLDRLGRVDGIYAVYTLNEPATQGMLRGTYGVLLTAANGDYLELRIGAGIVGLADATGWWTPADLLSANAADIILPPLE